MISHGAGTWLSPANAQVPDSRNPGRASNSNVSPVDWHLDTAQQPVRSLP